MIEGPAGTLEVLVDHPAPASHGLSKGVASAAARGLAIVAHPHPLLGGNATHKVPQVLARGLAETGWHVLRPQFRGVAGSAGEHDHGDGETDDILAVLQAFRPGFAELPVALLGFSFGAFVQTRVAQRLMANGSAAQHLVLAGVPAGTVISGRSYQPEAVPSGSLVIHGEHDEVAPLAGVLEWARPLAQPVAVVPGADHVFTGRLAALRALVVAHLR